MAKAKRDNSNKPQLSRFFREFPLCNETLARVMAFGAAKYNEGNWKLGGKPDAEYLDSGMRHLNQFLNGETHDQDSACHHLGHAIWNFCALLEINYAGDAPTADNYNERLASVRSVCEKPKTDLGDWSGDRHGC